MMDKKGQGAMEYLMTYGWAILIVVVVGGIILALAGPGKLWGKVPTQGCEVGQITVDANDWNYKSSGSMDMIVGNEMSTQINITQVNVTAKGGSGTANPYIEVGAGKESSTITVSGLPTGSSGDRVEPTAKITYDVQDGLSGQAATCDLMGTMS